jgi:hypothetical protein
MRNIAKCKLCESIVESTHEKDYVTCKCGEISVDGGELMRCAAKNFTNFIRVDDEGNEIVVKVIDSPKPTKEELINYLDEMRKSIEQLPTNALLTPVTQYDLAAALLLIHSIFKAND